MPTPAVDFWSILSGALQLRPEAFADAVRYPSGWYVTTAIVLLAGFSEAVGQSVVLFANKVKPARFLFSLLINALLFAFGYVFLVVSTWAILQLPGRPHVAIGDLAVVLALSYAPMLFAFLIALPYLGYGIGWLLKTAHLVAMVVAVGTLTQTGPSNALLYVGLGWLVLAIATQTIGRPVAMLGERILNAVAGVEVTSNEQILIERFGANDAPRAVDGGAAATAPAGAVTVASKSHSGIWKAVLGIGFMLAVAYICALTLGPVHRAAFGWQDALPKVVQVPLNLLWIALLGLIVAGFMAPLETLGWWAGWYGDNVRKDLKDTIDCPDDGGSVSRYVVYLDGISQSGEQYTPDVETFLDALAPRLPRDVRLIRGVMTYSVINRPLDDDPVLSWFWKLADRLRFKNPRSLLGLVVNLRNTLIVAVSADTRYGPIYNYGIGQVVYDALIANGYRANSGTPVTFIGYSGGGQMSAAAAVHVRRAIDAPVDIISLGGVMSGNNRIIEIEHLYHFVGDKDVVERIGPIMFPSRWRIAVISNWNRALRLGRLSLIGLGPVGHNVPGGLMDPTLKLPDGRSALDQTIDNIELVLTGRLESQRPPVPLKPNNYERYSEAPFNQPDAFPIQAVVDTAWYEPVAPWSGRLILPLPDERAAVDGAWFEVHLAPEPFEKLVGRRVKLRWADEPIVQEMVRAVTRDVHFSAQAEYSSRHQGFVQPVRLDHWRLVDPLESLAGARPNDDMFVMLRDKVDVEDGDDPVLRVRYQPVQISGRYRALVQFLAPAADNCYEVTHFNSASRAFDGLRETIRIPAVVNDSGGRATAISDGFENLPINAHGWYVYGAPDDRGVFTVLSLLPRAMLSLTADVTTVSTDPYRYVRKSAWKDIVAHKGSALSVKLGNEAWSLGDRALLTHVYGGIGGTSGEREASGPVYFGHFAFGAAEVIHDTLADELIFDVIYEQVYTHNGDGLIAGALHMSRYLGDRQFGWMGLRPTCDLLLKLDEFTSPFAIDHVPDSGLEALRIQLEAMTSRYRIGDGTGATYVGAANNCSQDANRALFAALEGFDRFVLTDEFALWNGTHPADAQRSERLIALAKDLRKQLQPLGTARRDWTENQFNLGSAMTDDPIAQLKTALGSWRVILPRMAGDTIAKTFFAHGAAGWILASSQIGHRPDIEPIVPMTL